MLERLGGGVGQASLAAASTVPVIGFGGGWTKKGGRVGLRKDLQKLFTAAST